MRPSIERLKPRVWRSTSEKHLLYAELALGNLARVEGGGYRLQGGDVIATGERQAILAVIGQVMDRLDQALNEEVSATDHPSAE